MNAYESVSNSGYPVCWHVGGGVGVHSFGRDFHLVYIIFKSGNMNNFTFGIKKQICCTFQYENLP